LLFRVINGKRWEYHSESRSAYCLDTRSFICSVANRNRNGPRSKPVFQLSFMDKPARNYRDTLCANRELYSDFSLALLDEGVLALPDGRSYISTAILTRTLTPHSPLWNEPFRDLECVGRSLPNPIHGLSPDSFGTMLYIFRRRHPNRPLSQSASASGKVCQSASHN